MWVKGRMNTAYKMKTVIDSIKRENRQLITINRGIE